MKPSARAWGAADAPQACSPFSVQLGSRETRDKVRTSLPGDRDSYDNAPAETINGLYKTEVIHPNGPWRNVDEVEFATLEWVDWFNNRRPFGPIGYIPPAEFEALYHQQQGALAMEPSLN